MFTSPMIVPARLTTEIPVAVVSLVVLGVMEMVDEMLRSPLRIAVDAIPMPTESSP